MRTKVVVMPRFPGKRGRLPTVTVIHIDTGEILSEHSIDPDTTYLRNTQKEPGR